MRHHRPVQLEIFYYPDEVTLDNGPTCVIPYSHYWTTNHEDSSDNFSGPDHLFTKGGTRDGERPQKDPEDIVERGCVEVGTCLTEVFVDPAEPLECALLGGLAAHMADVETHLSSESCQL